MNILTIKEITYQDINYVVNYWLDATPEFLTNMGVDVEKRPKKNQLIKLILNQLSQPLENRKNFFLLWLINGVPVGYSNINKIEYSKQAFMHMHLWDRSIRQRGIGTKFIKKSIAMYFQKFDLQFLFCEPYALNSAPNSLLRRVGFEEVKQYFTIPGVSNFEQLVNQWKLSRTSFEENLSLEFND